MYFFLLLVDIVLQLLSYANAFRTIDALGAMTCFICIQNYFDFLTLMSFSLNLSFNIVFNLFLFLFPPSCPPSLQFASIKSENNLLATLDS